MKSNFYLRVVVGALLLVGVIFYSCQIARAETEYPGFIKPVYDVVMSQTEEVAPGIRGVEIYVPDKENAGNEGGFIYYGAAINLETGNIGVMVVVLDSDRLPIIGYGVFYDTTTLTYTGVSVIDNNRFEMTEETAKEFFEFWLTKYMERKGQAV